MVAHVSRLDYLAWNIVSPQRERGREGAIKAKEGKKEEGRERKLS